MSLYYPQGGVILRPRWEDFGTGAPVLQEVKDLTVSCRSLRVERNDYSEADTFSATIDYQAFPFDPRCIRACGITICMEDRKKTFNGDNSLNLIEPSRDNIVFLGFVDESSISFDDTTRTVKLEGRDYTSLFIDQKRVNTDPIPLTKPIDELIKDLINEQEATKEITVENRTGEALPALSKLASDFNPVTSVKNVKRKETYWEIMQSIVNRVGLVGFIELDRYVITKPQNVYEKRNIKHFIYGGNIKDLNFTRRLGRAKDFNVLVKSFNSIEKRVEEAKIPEEANDEGFKSRHGSTEITVPQLDKDGKKIEPPKTADYYTFLVKDVTNKEQLIKIGESIFDELSRQQIEGNLTTFEMEVPEEVGNETNPILFSQIRNGSAIRIFLDQQEIQEISSNANKAQRLAFLLRRGYPRPLADAFADSLSRINTVFYVKSVMFEMDMDNGFTMKIEFINFIDLDSRLLL
jgi:hypothetical protein